jgi:hypothetical protein
MTPDHEDDVAHAQADRHDNRRALYVVLCAVVVIIVASILFFAG